MDTTLPQAITTAETAMAPEAWKRVKCSIKGCPKPAEELHECSGYTFKKCTYTPVSPTLGMDPVKEIHRSCYETLVLKVMLH
jgi:hypothetical protein